MAPQSDATSRWEALARRDRAADGSFYYSVSTTGVYCRPSCASRPARRDHVRFHDTREDAERAGFRPCKRCRPDGPPREAANARAVEEACRAIAAAESGPGLAELAARANMSPGYFHRVFRSVTGLTPKQYADALRTGAAREKLAAGAPVTEAIYAAGYNSGGRFYESADRALGMKPSTYRAGGANEEIRWAAGECSLGRVLVAVGSRGVCSILLGDDDGELAADLARRFPRARITPGGDDLADAVRRAAALAESPAASHGLPLDIRGTAFQHRVWRALLDIPAGETATYADVARRIGAPTSARAVANACAANPLAIAVPCHRVVAADGELAGYRWGVERKRALLDRE